MMSMSVLLGLGPHAGMREPYFQDQTALSLLLESENLLNLTIRQTRFGFGLWSALWV